ncbi:MAG TPA: hypothetical protein EYG86_07885 [Crocinitomicaceae bacterium]|nr:hypothetical protein [Crocinitomicaceae bacterium]
MGIIENQSKNNLVILVLAVLFGALNNMILFPTALSKEEWGIIRFLPTLAIIGSNLALFGTPQILLKFMPSYKDDSNQNGGLLRFNLLLGSVGLLLMIALLIFFKNGIGEVYEENASRLNDYYIYIFPLLILSFLTEILSAFARAHFHSVFQLFLKEIVHRIVQAFLLVLLIVKVIDFNLFILLFSFSLSINVVFLLNSLKKKNILDLQKVSLPKKEKQEILKYGFSSLLTTFGASVTGRIDSLMVTALVSGGILAANGGLEAVAIYSFGAYLVTIVEMPARAVSSIANSIIAQAWDEDNVTELKTIYQKTAINQMLVGMLLFILIWAGIDELFELIGKYEEAKWVVLFLGLGKLVNISSGSHAAIIVTSKFYIFSMYGMMLLAIMTFALNLYFIPLYGINGAAIATLIALVVYNGLSILLLKIKVNLQPFTKQSIILFIISAALFYLANWMDFNWNPIIEIGVKSIILSTLFVASIYFLRVSPDMNQTIRNIIRKTSKKIARVLVFPFLHKIGGEKWLNKGASNAILNIMYHGVVENFKGNNLNRNISAIQFEKHLIYLKENFEILSLEECKTQIKNRTLKRQAVILSFDDGFENNLSVVLPLLEKYNVPATIYVLGYLANENYQAIHTTWSNYVDLLLNAGERDELKKILGCDLKKQNEFYHFVKEKSSNEMMELLLAFENSSIVNEVLHSAERESYKMLSRKQILQLSNSPLITIGSHAYWHCNIGKQNKAASIEELKKSKQELEELIGKQVKTLAYPDGSYTRDVIDIAEEVGYDDQWAVAYQYSEDNSDPRIIHRFGVATQTTFESNMFFINKAFSKKSF